MILFSLYKNIWLKPLVVTLNKKHASKEILSLRGCSYGGELARLRGLAQLGEMVFIPRSYGIFYLS